MPAYNIRYLDEAGLLAHAFSAICDNDARARILAHALKLPSCKSLEVWQDEVLVHATAAMAMPLAS